MSSRFKTIELMLVSIAFQLWTRQPQSPSNRSPCRGIYSLCSTPSSRETCQPRSLLVSALLSLQPELPTFFLDPAESAFKTKQESVNFIYKKKFMQLYKYVHAYIKYIHYYMCNPQLNTEEQIFGLCKIPYLQMVILRLQCIQD